MSVGRDRRKAMAAGVLAGGGMLVAVLVGLNLNAGRSLQIGETLQPFPYSTENGPGRLAPSLFRDPTLLMLFHPKCGHCEYQLHLLNRKREAFGRWRLVFLTTDTDVDFASIRRQWPCLNKANRCGWGIVHRDTLKSRIGRVPLPTFLVFDTTGTLSGKWSGEMKFSALKSVLQSLEDY